MRRLEVVLKLPDADSATLDRVASDHPEMRVLWDLMGNVARLAFGDQNPFGNPGDREDRAFQEFGRKLIPEISAGRYDKGLKAAFSGEPPTFRGILSQYKGPITADEADALLHATLVNGRDYRFAHFEAPAYPPLARQARIAGRVVLKIAVDSATGAVRDVAAVSGHPLLVPSTVESARRWSFEPGGPQSVTLTIEYSYPVACEAPASYSY